MGMWGRKGKPVEREKAEMRDRTRKRTDPRWSGGVEKDYEGQKEGGEM
jgi:hypothetical protein